MRKGWRETLRGASGVFVAETAQELVSAETDGVQAVAAAEPGLAGVNDIRVLFWSRSLLPTASGTNGVERDLSNGLEMQALLLALRHPVQIRFCVTKVCFRA